MRTCKLYRKLRNNNYNKLRLKRKQRKKKKSQKIHSWASTSRRKNQGLIMLESKRSSWVRIFEIELHWTFEMKVACLTIVDIAILATWMTPKQLIPIMLKWVSTFIGWFNTRFIKKEATLHTIVESTRHNFPYSKQNKV